MTAETLPPPRTVIGPIAWLRQNLFSGPISSLMTILLGAALVWIVLQIGTWALTEARWSVVSNNLRLFLIGQYPGDQSWRIWLTMAILSVLSGLSAGVYGQASRMLAITLSAVQLLLAALMLISPIGLTAVLAYGFNAAVVWAALAVSYRGLVPRRPLAWAWVASLPIAFLLLAGFGGTPLESVSSNAWGGLLLTVLLATVGILLSFPMGVLLALGRRSELPIIRGLSTGYIELIRGVPLISLLFMASVMLPLFLPAGVTIDKLLRAQIALILFAAAYLAEVVRGGLQAIPRSQYEAAAAIGLGYWGQMGYVILPQALRIAVPPLVNTFIGFFKDTSLVLIIGLFDLLSTIKVSLTDPAWTGFGIEAYVFASLVYFAFCFVLSRYSRRFEVKPSPAHAAERLA